MIQPSAEERFVLEDLKTGNVHAHSRVIRLLVSHRLHSAEKFRIHHEIIEKAKESEHSQCHKDPHQDFLPLSAVFHDRFYQRIAPDQQQSCGDDKALPGTGHDNIVCEDAGFRNDPGQCFEGELCPVQQGKKSEVQNSAQKIRVTVIRQHDSIFCIVVPEENQMDAADNYRDIDRPQDPHKRIIVLGYEANRIHDYEIYKVLPYRVDQRLTVIRHKDPRHQGIDHYRQMVPDPVWDSIQPDLSVDDPDHADAGAHEQERAVDDQTQVSERFYVPAEVYYEHRTA